MEDSRNMIYFEEVKGDEVDDIWDIFFPKTSERKSNKLDPQEQTKPRRYLKFLAM